MTLLYKQVHKDQIIINEQIFYIKIKKFQNYKL
jgi:hypothetical protein